MKKKYMVLSARKTLTILFFSCAVLLGSGAILQTAWASSGGRTGYSGNPATNSGAICTNCHSPSGSAPTVALTGPTSLPTGSTSVYTFKITGGAAVDGGFDVSTTGTGTLQATDPNTKLSGGEVTHNAAISFTSGSLSFTFTLHAPASAGTITLYASGLSANGSGSSGDNAAKTTLAVNVTGALAPQIVITDGIAPATDHQIPFGTVLNGVTSDQTVTVSNSGNANLAIDQIASANPLAAPFSITADHCTGVALLPAESCTLTVRFAPITSGLVNDTFDIPSNDPTTPSAVVSVSGTGSAAPAPQIVITDAVAPATDQQIPFGTVLNGVTSDQTVTVSNSGNANLAIDQIANANPLAAPFSITADHCTGVVLLPAESCTLTIRFAPTTSGPFSDTFDIPSNDPTTPSALVSVSGTGSSSTVPQITIIDPIAPGTDQQIPFGTVLNNVTSDQTVTVSNSGNGDLVVGQIASANPLAAPFSITADTCSGQSIVPAGACTLIVRFAPAVAGAFSDTFDIPSNDPSTPSAMVSVSGTSGTTGNNPPTAPSLVSPADGETGVGTTATLEWQRSTDPDGDAITYNLYYCTDSTFASCSPVVAYQGRTGIYLAGSGLLFLGFVMTRGGRGRKYMLVLMMAMLLTTGVFIVSCSSGSDSDNGGSTNMTYQVSGLHNATTYYWKVVADDGKGGQTSSQTQSFTTQ